MASDPADSSVEPKTAPSAPAEKEKEKELTLLEEVQRIPSRVFKKDAALTLAVLIAGAVGASIGIAKGEDWMGGVAAKTVAPLIQTSEEKQAEALKKAAAAQQAALDAVELRLKSEIADVKAQAALKEERDGKRFEFLIQTVLTGKYQPGAAALTRPPDGGP